MGRVTQAMRRARQSGIVTELEPLALTAPDASVLAAEPFPAESVQALVVPEPQPEPEPELVRVPKPEPEPPKAEVSSGEESAGHDDLETQRLFFNTYPEKVWRGPNQAQERLQGLLAKVERHRKLRFARPPKDRR